MRIDLQRQVLATMARHGMIPPGSRIGLGVSGGADSTAMLLLLCELRERLGARFIVLHFNHQLRGREADEDEKFVRDLAARFELPFECGRADVAAEASRNRWNLEDAARRLRYRFFSEAARANAIDKIAVAHTADDQAETVLSHLLRGTGIAGLAGIYPTNGQLIRPLLDVRRADLREFLARREQAWREDATNLDVTRVRARIRHRLLPLLESDFEPSAVLRLARLAEHAREDEACWGELEGRIFAAMVRRESAGALSIAVADLLSPLDPSAMFARRRESPAGTQQNSPVVALSRRLVRCLFTALCGSREGLTLRHVDAVLSLAQKSQSGAQADLPGVRVERVFDRLHFTRVDERQESAGRTREKSGEFSYTLSLPASRRSAFIAIPEIHRRISLKMVDWPPARSETVTSRGALDFDRVHFPLVLRNWRPGDSYQPQGSRRARKLNRLLLKSRVPRAERISWPVLTCAGSVIWASGYPVAQEWAAGRNTRVGLLIGEEPL